MVRVAWEHMRAENGYEYESKHRLMNCVSGIVGGGTAFGHDLGRSGRSITPKYHDVPQFATI
eukprot:9494085-Pyramimonas_sp.AAC.1